jgi:hypothetical protein
MRRKKTKRTKAYGFDPSTLLPIKMELQVRKTLSAIKTMTWRVAYLKSEFFSLKQIAKILKLRPIQVATYLSHAANYCNARGKEPPWYGLSYVEERLVKAKPKPRPKPPIIILTWEEAQALWAEQRAQKVSSNNAENQTTSALHVDPGQIEVEPSDTSDPTSEKG